MLDVERRKSFCFFLRFFLFFFLFFEIVTMFCLLSPLILLSYCVCVRVVRENHDTTVALGEWGARERKRGREEEREEGGRGREGRRERGRMCERERGRQEVRERRNECLAVCL